MSRQLAAELKDIGSVRNNRSWHASAGRRQLGGRGETIRKIRAAFETSGIEFHRREQDLKVYDFGRRIVQDESNCKPVRPIRRLLRIAFAASAAAKAAAKEKLRSGHRGVV